MKNKEHLLDAHQRFAAELSELMRQPKDQRDEARISEVIAVIKRTGRELAKFPETGDFSDSEQPDVFHRHAT